MSVFEAVRTRMQGAVGQWHSLNKSTHSLSEKVDFLKKIISK